jgi:integrase
MGLFQPTYTDKKTKAQKRVAMWWALYWLNGRKIRESTGHTKHEAARTWLRKRQGAIARGESVTPKADRVTFADMATRLRDDFRMNKKHVPTLEARLGHLIEAFGAMRLARLIPDDVARYVTARLGDGASNGTVNRELEVLARAFRLGSKLGLLNATLDVRGHRLAEAPPRQGFFEFEQFEAVRRELAQGARPRDARPDLAVAVTIYFTFGWRVDEVLTLETRQVRLDEGDHGSLRLDAGSTKNGDGRLVYLTPETRQLLDEQRARVTTLEHQLGRVVPFLFPHLTGRHRGERVQDFPKAWRSACQRAGCPGLLRHDFRRTAARNMVNAGVPERIAMTVTGHRTRAMFDRYHIVSPGEQQEAARRIAVASEAAAQRTIVSRRLLVPNLSLRRA